MKRVLLFLLTLSVGCNRQGDNKSSSQVDNDVKESLAQQLDGYWLSDSYLSDIETSRSIYETGNYRTRFWGFQLTNQNLLSDSAIINGFTEHEGGDWVSIKFDSLKKCFTSYPTTVNEKSFTMSIVDSTHLVLDFGDKRDVYRRIDDEQTELRKILFQGQFRDLLHNNMSIEFRSDGTVNGLNDKKYFELVFDFGEGIDYDVSIFYPDIDSAGLWTRGDLFHFKLNSDTIKLYKITPDWNEMDHKIGDLEYLLVKS